MYMGGVFIEVDISFDGWNNVMRLRIIFFLKFRWLVKKFFIGLRL